MLLSSRNAFPYKLSPTTIHCTPLHIYRAVLHYNQIADNTRTLFVNPHVITHVLPTFDFTRQI